MSDPEASCIRSAAFLGTGATTDPTAQLESRQSTPHERSTRSPFQLVFVEENPGSPASKMSPIVLILGAGSNIGVAAAKQFAETGYQVATVSRTAAEPPATTPEGYLSIRADLSKVDEVRSIFDKIQSSLGGVPSVIIYNAAHVSPCTESGNIFSVPLHQLDADIDLMIKGPYVAAGEAYNLWRKETTSGHKKLFIYTGNIFPKVILPIPDMTTMGIAKVGSCFWLGMADKLYKEKGFR